MPEQLAHVGGIEIAYECFGDRRDPAVLLIMGLGTQMVGWSTAFCERLAAKNLYVVRFDNRDIGHSTVLDSLGIGRTAEVLAGRPGSARYRLEDMAADAIGLLDALGIERAHLVGASMGGMIAQLVAIIAPERVMSLTSIMSNTGRRFVGAPSPKLLPHFLRRAPVSDRQDMIEHAIDLWRAIGSRPPLFDEEMIREIAQQSIARGIDTSGVRRQLAAITTAKDRTARLRRLELPALVIHGSVDTLVHRSGGRATARAIPAARYVEIAGMGHDLPRVFWDQILGEIGALIERVPDQSSVVA